MNENLAVLQKDIQVARAINEGDMYIETKTKLGTGMAARYNSLTTAYNAIKTTGLTTGTSNARKLLFPHYIMALKLSGATNKNTIMKNLNGLTSISAAV